MKLRMPLPGHPNAKGSKGHDADEQLGFWHHVLGIINYTIEIGSTVFPAVFGFSFAALLAYVRHFSFSNFFSSNNIDSKSLPFLFAALGWLFAFYYFARYTRRARQLKVQRHYNARILKNTERWMDLALNHRNCDKKLFDLLFVHQAEGALDLGTLMDAFNLIEQNLKKILDLAKMIFDEISGHKCAACIKLVHATRDESGQRLQILDFSIKTMMRDGQSEETRGSRDETTTEYVKDVKSDVYIFTRNEDGEFRNTVYACDNLPANKDYFNKRTSYQNDYTATIVSGIRDLNKDSDTPWAGLFCVDNKHGNIDNDMCKYYARELSSRISVLLYRYNYLKGAIEEARLLKDNIVDVEVFALFDEGIGE